MLNKTVSLIDMIKLSHNIELSKPYIQYLCGLDKAGTYRHQEILDIQSLLTEVNLPEESVSGFLYGYVVPQLNREFDLLRISQNVCLNIELKSTEISIEKIKRQLIQNIMTQLVAPQPGERCNDPACGTFGFMIAADRYVKDHTDNLFELPVDQQEFQRTQAFSGCELVHDTHRLALMNAMLHDIGGPIYLGDTLSNFGKGMKGYDVVLTNPPFGTKKGGERATRDDFTFPTSNKQLNFLQHIYRSLNKTGKARAAVVLPDNVLFADGDGERIRRDLMEKCNLHTILRLPTGIFYAQGVKTNVLFFTRGYEDKGNTREIWFYDLRSDMPSFGKTNPLKESHFDEFVECYKDGDLSARTETYSEDNPNGRWRKFTYEEILARDKTSLDITWMKSDNGTEDYTLSELLEQIKEKSANIAKAVAALEELIGEVDE